MSDPIIATDPGRHNKVARSFATPRTLVDKLERMVLVRWKIRLMLNLNEAVHQGLGQLIGSAVRRLWDEPQDDSDIENISRQAKGILEREWERAGFQHLPPSS